MRIARLKPGERERRVRRALAKEFLCKGRSPQTSRNKPGGSDHRTVAIQGEGKRRQKKLQWIMVVAVV